MKREFLDYIDDIVSEIGKIEDFVKDMSEEQFVADIKTIYASVRSFEIIGEAVKNIPNTIKEQYSEIPWRYMAGMRDKLIHEYFGVSVEILWETIKIRIPEVKLLIIKLKSDFK